MANCTPNINSTKMHQFFVKNTIGVLLLFVKMAVSLRNLVSGVGLQLFTINVYTRKC